MGWTTEQQRAIDERNKNILVAAAAGSGKTAVLVERIKKLVLEENVPIDRMLIVTFTNAAASEMKEKLRKSLTDEIEKNPAKADKLREKLRRLPRASISTFHAFALDVMRNFSFFSDLEPGFSICDDAQRTILKEEAMDELIEKYFEMGTDDFYDFLDCYSSDRNLDKIREIIDSSYTVLQSLPYPWKWMREKVAFLDMNEEEMKQSKVFSYMWSYFDESIEKAYANIEKAYILLYDSGFERLAGKIAGQDLSICENIKKVLPSRSFEELGNAVNSFSAVKLVPNKEEKESYVEIKNQIAAYRSIANKTLKKLKENFFMQSLNEQIEDINATAKYGRLLEQILLDYDHLFKAKKQEKKLVDFNDIEHYCLEILENQESADAYCKKFEYIFIDEYQDTNILQEEIIAKIKREDNVFMVGDIKQSIYKFRLAEPEIFKEKYENYKNACDGKSAKIDLNRNFRSKPAILECINTIFENLMDGYDDKAKLYPGMPYDGPHRYVPEIEVIDAGTKESADDEVAALKNAEIEALEVCKIIKQNVGKIIFDQKKGVERTLELKDIVILMRGVRNYAEVYYNVMKEQGIDGFIDDSESYFDTIEIDIWMKLLSVIDNKMQDIPLISVLHSEIFGFSANELAEIRVENRNETYAEAFLEYCKTGTNSVLKEKCSIVLDTLNHWRQLSLSMPLGKFIWRIMLESGYYNQMGAMPGGVQRQMNLSALIDKAEKYAAERPGSLYNFIRYIETLKYRKVQVGQVKLVGENDNLVRIMTIHKSKGLEFPMVILCGAGKRLNYTKLQKGVNLHKDIGIGMHLVNYKEHWNKQTLLQRLIKEQVHKEEVEEEIRILYVALTRAKDLLYITGIVKDGEKFKENCSLEGVGDSSYLAMIGDTYPMKLINAATIDYNKETENRKFDLKSEDNYLELIDKKSEEEIIDKLNYEYPFKESRKLKSKYSVSELNREEADFSAMSKITLTVPKFRQSEHKITAAERGTVYHSLMEHIDFVKAREEISYVENRAKELVDKGILTVEELSAVNLSVIENFFNTELGMRCVVAAQKGTLDKERSFTLQTEMDGNIVMVQGIIDCFFEEEDSIVLIDYKTNWLDSSKIEEEEQRLRQEYKKQLETYKSALEKSTGKRVKEAYICHLESGCAIKM